MKLNLNGNDIDEIVTESILEKHLMSLPGGDADSFLILSKSELSYIQTSGSPNEGFILEYQEGDIAKHYTCTTSPLSTSQVLNAFRGYLLGSESWKVDLSREKEDLSSGSSRFGAFKILLIGLLIFVVTIVVLNA